MKNTYKTLRIAAVVTGCILPTAHAQTMPNIGDALRQSQPPAVPPAAHPELPAIEGLPIEPPLQALPDHQPKIKVNAFNIVGNREIDTATLMTELGSEGNKDYSLAEMEAVATRLTHYYRSHGYFVARVYVPAQEVQDGNVTLRVVEGNYGQFHLKNNALVRDDIVQGMLDDVKDEDIVSLDTLERAMLIINDTPGVQVTRADVMPGSRVGTSGFAVDTTGTSAYNGFIMLDNYGTRYTGEGRLSFNVDANSPTGRGDRLSLTGLTTETADLLNGRLAYSLPLAANGLRGEAAFSQTQYQLGYAYSSLDAQGTARAADLTLSYPLRRIRAQTIETSLNVNYKDLQDEIRSTGTRTPKSLVSATLGLSLRDEAPLLGAFGVTEASIGLRVGSLNIQNTSAAALDRAGANTQGEYGKLIASLSRISLLPLDFSLTASFRCQQSLGDKNLDGSERMTASGYTAVMAYPSGDLIGTNATYARLELARPFPEWNRLKSNWLVFTDWGQASAANAVSSSDRSRNIGDVGIGLTGSYQGAILKVYVAHRLDSAQAVSEPVARDKVLAQIGWVF